MKEIWKNIEWYEKYKVSNFGNIKNINKILKLEKTYNWYNRISLYKNAKYKRFLIHRLVAQAFLWLDISNKKMLVCHKDDIRDNNNVNNLFIWTQKDNLQDMVQKWRNNPARYWLWKKLDKHCKSKKVNQYDLEWNLITTWTSAVEIENKLWFLKWNIWLCCRGKLNTAYKYKWEYL